MWAGAITALRRWTPRLAVALLLAGPLLAGQAQAAPAAQTNPITLTARAGFDGYYKDQRWLSIRITVANDGPDLTGTLRIVTPRYNSADLVVTRAVELPTQSRREIYLYVPTEGYLSSLKVSLLDDKNKEIASATSRLAQTNSGDLVYGVVAGAPSARSRMSVLRIISLLNLGDVSHADIASCVVHEPTPHPSRAQVLGAVLAAEDQHHFRRHVRGCGAVGAHGDGVQPACG